MRNLIFAGSLCLICTLPLLGQKNDFGALLDRRMRVIAGKDAVDCGHVKLGHDPQKSLSCARRAISQERAFVVRFDIVGTDSLISDGFAGNSLGNVYSVRFDTYGWGPGPGVEI